jgi:hypothetical protein
VADPRYVVDEHISDAVVQGLRRAGINVLKFHDAGRRGLDDAQQMAWAFVEGRVIITHDDDYIVLARRDVRCAGIAYCDQHKYDTRGVLRELRRWHAELSAEDWVNRVVFL